jgi:hypothetical membrane protein
MTASATTPVSAATTSTRALLLGAAVAGPLWAVVSLAQAAARTGFDLTRHPLSALSNGSLGWLQITNFVVAGVLTAAGSAGLRRVLRGRPGGTWVPRLVGISGLGLIAAGVFVMDPAGGFPAGAPAGMPETMSRHSYGHMAAGSITFLALIAACYVLARHFALSGRRAWSIAGAVAGTALVAGDGWAMSGGAAGPLTLAVGAVAAMLFVSATAAVYARR